MPASNKNTTKSNHQPHRGTTKSINKTKQMETKSQGRPTCFQTYFAECFPCQAWFAVEEPSTLKKLDVAATFGPVGFLPIVQKLNTCGYILVTQVQAWLASPNLAFYYAYFTSWAMGLASLYSLLSISNSICALSQPDNGRVQGRGKFTWIVFNLAVFAQSLATVIYWTLVHDYDEDEIDYLSVATHGLVFLGVCIDGFVFSRIPLRWMHLWLNWILTAIYLGWTIVHNLLEIGNPNENDNDEETNDDAIYSRLSWREDDREGSATLSGLVLLLVTPVLFGLLRTISVYNPCCCCMDSDGKGGHDRRRYLEADIEQGYRRVK